MSDPEDSACSGSDTGTEAGIEAGTETGSKAGIETGSKAGIETGIGTGIDAARRALAAARAQARKQARRGSVGGGIGAGWGDTGGSGGNGGGEGGYARHRRSLPGDEVRSGPRPDDRDPQTLSTAVDRLVADRGWEVDAAAGALLGRWPALVGPEVAAHAQPEGLVDGVLTVRASSTAWAVQLGELAPALRTRVEAELGPGTCRRVAVVGPVAPSWRRGRLSVRGRGPRDTYG